MSQSKEVDRRLTAWSIDARHDIQRAILDLYKCSVAPRLLSSKNSDLRDVYNLLVGASFALWRAAFLADNKNRNSKTAVRDTKPFMRAIFESNIINFPNELAAIEWSGGFYINNCGFRLERIHRQVPQAAQSREFKRFLRWWPSQVSWGSTQRAWDVMFPALSSAVDWVMTEVDIDR